MSPENTEGAVKSNPRSSEPDSNQAPTQEKPPTPGSLRDRMRQRRRELERRTHGYFAVPLYEDFVAVKLRVISWDATEEAIEKNANHRKGLMLRTAMEEIVQATSGFFAVNDDGDVMEDEPIEDANSWFELATKLAEVKVPDSSPRKEQIALLGLCTDQGVMGLNSQFRRWLGGQNTGLAAVSRELRQDF